MDEKLLLLLLLLLLLRLRLSQACFVLEHDIHQYAT
jgi:hypothetical protein